MVDASGGRHTFIRGYQTLLAAVDADNASQVSGPAIPVCIMICVTFTLRHKVEQSTRTMCTVYSKHCSELIHCQT